MGRYAVWAAGAIAGASVLVVVVVAFSFVPFGFPLMDELQQAHGSGIWSDIKTYYFGYSGRWASIGLESLFLRHLDIVRLYPVMLGGCLLTILAGLAALCHTLFGKGASWLASLGMGAILFALMWVNMPLPSDGLYWFEAALEDPVSLSLVLILMSVVATAGRMRPWTVRWVATTLALGCLTAIAGGMHEDTSSVLLGTLATVTVLAYWRRSEAKYQLTFLTLTALASWLVLLCAPGNGVRSEGFPHPKDVAFTLKLLQEFGSGYFLKWISDPRLILALLALLLHLDDWESWRHWARPLTLLQRLWIVLSFCGMLSGAILGPMFLQGSFPVNRLILLLHLFFLCGSVILLVVFAAGSRPSALQWCRKQWWIKTAVWLGFAATLISSPNIALARRDLSGDAQAYKNDMLQRDASLRRLSERNVRAAVVTPLPWRLNVLPVADVTADPNYAFNRATAAFYFLKSVRVETRNKIVAWDLMKADQKREWEIKGITNGYVDGKTRRVDFINRKISCDADKAIQFRLRVKCALNGKEGATQPSKVRLYWATDGDLEAHDKTKTLPFVEECATNLVNLSRDGIEWSVDLRNKPKWKGQIAGVMLRFYFTDEPAGEKGSGAQISVRNMEILGEAPPGQVIAWEDGAYR